MRSALLSIALLSAFAVSACSCIDVGLSGHFKNADAVFEAISLGSSVLSPEEASNHRMDRVITMKVTKVYKGTLSTGILKVFTSSSGSSCGAWFPFGGRYLVFGSATAESLPVIEQRASAYTGRCWGNKFYLFWKFGLRKNVQRLVRGEKIPERSRWSKAPSW